MSDMASVGNTVPPLQGNRHSGTCLSAKPLLSNGFFMVPYFAAVYILQYLCSLHPNICWCNISRLRYLQNYMYIHTYIHTYTKSKQTKCVA
jgi:hypothetical protein